MRWPVDGVRNVIRYFGTGNEKIRRLKAEELVDDSVVRKLEREGRTILIDDEKKVSLRAPSRTKA